MKEKKEVQVSHYHSTHFPLPNSLSQSNTGMSNIFRNLLRPFIHAQTASMPELFAEVEVATSATALRKAMNRVQDYLWNMSSQEQLLPRKRLITLLSDQTLGASDASLRLEAAGWLRFLMQSGMVAQPEEIFVTLVTASVDASHRMEIEGAENRDELASYLQMIFDCFWPFRYPYAVFTWESFPANEVFYPLAPLLESADAGISEALIAIFAELPTLDNREIVEHLLPVALAWAAHTDAEHRRQITNVLARISQSNAQEALRRLQSDSDPLVRASARRAAAYMQGA